MKQKFSQFIFKKEDGLNGINYALYIVAIVTVVVVYRYLLFESGLYVVQQHLQDSLHIVGSAGLAYNYGDTSLYETDLDRLYVIDLAKGTTSDAFNSGEEAQAKALGDWIAQQYVIKMGLTGDTNKIHPTDSMMITMCGEDAEILLSNLIIYQPLYHMSVVKNPPGSKTPFEISYDFKGNDGKYQIVKYEYSLSNNKVTGVSKKYIETSNLDSICLKNGAGDPISGTTIDMCTETILYGLNNIFAGVSTQTPAWGNTVKEYYDNGNGGYTEITYRELDAPTNSGGLFSDHPTRESYGIAVWEAVDIVPATNDDRAKIS